MDGFRWSVVGLVLLAGCAAEPGPGGVPPQPQPAGEVRPPLPSDGSLRSDRDTYTATCRGEGYEETCTFTLELTYTNRTDAAVYFQHCYPDDTTPVYSVHGLTEEESAYNGVWACVGHDRLPKLEPGERRVDVLELRGPNIWNGATGEPIGVLAGRLQVVYDLSSCPDEYNSDCLLPDEIATSNVFTVVLSE